jgi:hypothetical protein
VIATDEDGDDLTYLWQASDGEFSDTSTAETQWTSPSDTSGMYSIIVTVTDGKGGADIDAVLVQVTL